MHGNLGGESGIYLCTIRLIDKKQSWNSSFYGPFKNEESRPPFLTCHWAASVLQLKFQPVWPTDGPSEHKAKTAASGCFSYAEYVRNYANRSDKIKRAKNQLTQDYYGNFL
jgi:hypothetical protein